MNEHLYTTNDGLRLIQEFEGAPRLKARLCEGGAWELSYGVTFRPDGSRIREGETCTEAEAMTLFRHALGVFEQAVRDMVTVPLEPHQFSALVAWMYNIGIENARTSTVLREVNANRIYDAAAAFGMWIYATKNGYKQALRGLLRRRYAEACLFLGYDWAAACADEAIALHRETPATLPGTDRVRYKTPFKEVLAVAQRYPLAPPEPVLLPDPVERIEAPSASLPEVLPGPSFEGIPTQLPLPSPVEDEDELFLDTPAAAEEISGAKGAAPSPATQPEVARAPSQPDSNPAASPAGSRPAPATVAPQSPAGAGASPLPPPKPPPVIAPKSIDIKAIPYGEVDPSNGAKNMTDSTRFVGMLIVAGGSVVQVLAAREVVSSTAGAIFFDLSRDPVIVALIAGGVIWAVGSMTKWWGRKVITKGMIEAKEVLK